MRVKGSRVAIAAKKLRKAMDEVLLAAKEEGVANPVLFFEAEGTVYVMDADSPDWIKGGDFDSISRQRAVRFRVCMLPQFSDVGAW